MSEDLNNNKTIQAQSSETISGGSAGVAPDMDYVRPAELPDKIYIMDIVLLLNGFFVRMQKLLEYNIFF